MTASPVGLRLLIDGETSRPLISDPEHRNSGFSELREAVFVVAAPQDPPIELLIDDEPLPPAKSGNGETRWKWRPGFYAGEVRAELVDASGATRGRFRLEVSPDPNKLGEGHRIFGQMLNDILDFDPALLLGVELARQSLRAGRPRPPRRSRPPRRPHGSNGARRHHVHRRRLPEPRRGSTRAGSAASARPSGIPEPRHGAARVARGRTRRPRGGRTPPRRRRPDRLPRNPRLRRLATARPPPCSSASRGTGSPPAPRRPQWRRDWQRSSPLKSSHPTLALRRRRWRWPERSLSSQPAVCSRSRQRYPPGRASLLGPDPALRVMDDGICPSLPYSSLVSGHGAPAVAEPAAKESEEKD